MREILSFPSVCGLEPTLQTFGTIVPFVELTTGGSFFFQVILCTKEVAVKARSSALNLLIECCNAFFQTSGKSRQGRYNHLVTELCNKHLEVLF